MMSRTLIRRLAWCVLTAVAASAVAGEKALPCVAALAAFEKAPTIDGKLAPGEWDRAVGTAGFQMLAPQPGFLETRLGRSLVGYTAERLYIAVVSEMPPDGKRYASRTNRDSDVIFDESIEIWIDPNRERRATKQGDQSFYQLIGNSAGTIFDVRFDPNRGAPVIGWNGNWEYGNSVDPKTHTWTAEMSVPFADIGWKGPLAGHEIGVLVARNYKNPWTQNTWFPHRGAFVSWMEYPALKLTRDAPCVQIRSLGDKVHTGQLELAMHIANPGAAREAKVAFQATSTDMPGLTDEKTVKLPAGGSGTYAYKIPAGRLHTEAQHTFAVAVTDAAGKETWFRYRTQWTKAREKAWLVHTGPNPDAAVRMAYYPSFSLLKVRVDPRELGEKAAGVRKATVAVTDGNGKEVASQAIAWEEAPSEQQVKIPDLPDGDYTATIRLDGYAEPFVRKFKRIHFEWEGTRLGITDEVLPPFEPMQVAGDELSVVLRRHKVGALGLWDQVSSLGREMLAAPIVLKVNGGEALAGKGGFVNVVPEKRQGNQVVQKEAITDGAKAVYEGRAEHAAVSVKTRCTTEFDGCMKVELELLPGTAKQELDALWLEIPVRDAEAPLWHVCTSGLRLNPAGATPKGEGDVWDSRQFPDGNWFGNFKCYLWLGAEERGLCWFADNDRGWVLGTDDKGQPDAPCQQLIRKGGVLTLRVNLVQKPVTITEPRRIVFGLMASPAKPMPKDWRRVLFSGRRPGYLNIGWMGSTYWGTAETMHETYPLNHDLSILSKMQECRLTGDLSGMEDFVRIWSARNLAGDVPGTKTKDQIRGLVRWCLNHSAGRPDYYNVYWEEFHSVSRNHIETQVFGNEWSGGTWIGSCHSLAPSYLDFQCWYGAEFIRRGIGLYFDNTFPKRAYDPLTTAAYKLPNGQIQPSANMWRHREYLRRIWTLHRQLAPPATLPLMMLHMTNSHIVPYMVWNDSNLDLEWFYGPEPQQSKYPHDLLRTESLGRQTGNIPLVLASVDKTTSEEQKRIACRTRFGTMFVHEIKARFWGKDEQTLLGIVCDFGYGQEGCQVRNYWQADYPVAASDPECKSILLQRGRELLLVLCTWNPKPQTVALTLETKALGLSPSEAVDPETGEKLALEGGRKIVVPMPGYGVRAVRVK